VDFFEQDASSLCRLVGKEVRNKNTKNKKKIGTKAPGKEFPSFSVLA